MSEAPFYLDRPPFISVSGLPEPERKNADHLNILLGSLHEHVHGFRCALRLFDHANAARRESFTVGVFNPDSDHAGWMFIAAKGGVMDVYHVSILIGAIRQHIGRCPTLLPQTDTKELKTAQQQFEAYFPRIRRVRHAIAHAAEMVESPGAYEKNFRIDAESMWIVSALINRMIAFAHEGEQIYVEISEATLDRLETISRKIFDTIRPAADVAFALLSKERSPPPPD